MKSAERFEARRRGCSHLDRLPQSTLPSFTDTVARWLQLRERSGHEASGRIYTFTEATR